MTPLPEDFWPETMTRNGETATREQMAAAWEKWDWHSYSHLAAKLSNAGAGDPHKKWTCIRLADSMLQRARKAGHIRFEGGKWVEVAE